MKKIGLVFFATLFLFLLVGGKPVSVAGMENSNLNVVLAMPDAPWIESNKVSCGNIENIPDKVPQVVSTIVLVGQILVPVLLVLFGSLDLAKGVMSQKEDEIKKGQQTFVKRLMIGAMVFFIVALVKVLISVVGDTDTNKKNIISCIDCFVNGVENCGGASENSNEGESNSNTSSSSQTSNAS